MKTVLWCLLLSVLAGAAWAELPPIRFTLENVTSLLDIRSDSAANPDNIFGLKEFTNISRLTLDTEGTLDDRAAYGINARVSVDHTGDTDAELREGWIRIGSDTSPMLKVGKQKAAWGMGMLWTPTDYINYEVNALDPDDPISGKTMILAEYPFKDGSLAAVFVPDEDADTLEDGISAMRGSMLAGSWEIALTAGAGKGGTQDIGIAASVPMGEFIVYTELNYGKDPQKRYYYDAPDPGTDPYYNTYDEYTLSAVLGCNRYVGANGFLAAELFLNDAGYTPDEMRDLQELWTHTASMPLAYSGINAELSEIFVPGHMSRVYSYISYEYTLDDQYHLSLSLLSNLDSGFTYVTPAFSWSGISDVDLQILLTLPAGDTDEGEGALYPAGSAMAIWLTAWF